MPLKTFDDCMIAIQHGDEHTLHEINARRELAPVDYSDEQYQRIIEAALNKYEGNPEIQEIIKKYIDEGLALSTTTPERFVARFSSFCTAGDLKQAENLLLKTDIITLDVLVENRIHSDDFYENYVLLLNRMITEDNNDKAMYLRAYMHEHGFRGPINYPEAIRLYEMAIKKENDWAMHNRAYMHYQGHGGEVNFPEAIRLYEMAIDKGIPNAMNNRAWMHRHGEGGEINFAEAIRLYEMAIDKGNASAMNNRAWMHQHGLGGEVNFAEAIQLYEMAIDKGEAVAMSNRACMHYQGHGGEVNFPEAIRLFEMASRGGNSSSGDNLNALYRSNRANQSDAEILLLLIWDDLLKNERFSNHTIGFIAKHCSEAALNKLLDIDSPTRVDIQLLEAIKNNPNHAVARLLDGCMQKTRLANHIERLNHDKNCIEQLSKLHDQDDVTIAADAQGIVAGYLLGAIEPMDESDRKQRSPAVASDVGFWSSDETGVSNSHLELSAYERSCCIS